MHVTRRFRVARSLSQMAIVQGFQRTYPDFIGDESDITWSMLDSNRSMLLAKCNGLDEGQLKRRAVAPSRLSLLGLLRHMARVEAHWFVTYMEGEDVGVDQNTPDGDFERLNDTPSTEVVEEFLAACERSREIVKRHTLDDVAAKDLGDGLQINLRFIAVHMIEEYARHLGHADLLRELIDGVVGD
jgi:Protein of unknown function (DUF664)